MTAPRDIPGASNTTSTSTPATRTRANTFSYPRWDADGNSHHPPPDTSATRTLSQSTRSAQPAAASTSMAASPSSPASSSSAVNTPPSILRLLGLSPKTALSRDEDGGSPRPAVAGQGTGHGHGQGHRRGASYGGTASSFSYSYNSSMVSAVSSSSSPFCENDEDGPPEAVTPPQLQFPLDATVPPTGDKKQQQQHHENGTAKLTDYGHELDSSHKFELDDVFDGNSTAIPFIKSPPSSSATANPALHGAPLGRRASWSPAVVNHSTTATPYSSSPPGGPPPAVLSWLHGQQTSHPISSAHSHPQAIANPTSDYKDCGSSPVGLFRRLSLSVNRRPPPPAPASTISEVSDMTDKERIGRPLTKVTSAPPRRLSPMGERMLRAHYDSFS